MRIFSCARVELWDFFYQTSFAKKLNIYWCFSQFIDAGFWRKGKLTAALRRTFCSFYKRVLAKEERMTLFALISGWNFMILWFEVIITRENSFTKGQWNKGKKALFSMILISFFFSLSVLFLSLILCPLWISFDHGSWDWSWYFRFRSTEIESCVLTGSLHRWLKFIRLFDFDSIIAKFFYIAR